MAKAADMQVVTLGIEADRFAIPVAAVREILDMQALFRLPEAPPHVAGLADVRGRAVPVIDLRTRLGLPPQQTTEHTRILVLDVGILTIGLIADRVFEVTAIPRDHLDPAPDLGQSWKAQYIQNVAKHGDRFVAVLDLSAMVSRSEAAFLEQAADAAPLKEPA
jgi:purine-binding chemotaxis protein CheW